MVHLINEANAAAPSRTHIHGSPHQDKQFYDPSICYEVFQSWTSIARFSRYLLHNLDAMGAYMLLVTYFIIFAVLMPVGTYVLSTAGINISFLGRRYMLMKCHRNRSDMHAMMAVWFGMQHGGGI